MKSLIDLLQRVLNDTSTWCHTSADMDIKTIRARYEHEGLSFLTITLPNFGKDLEKGLDQGFVDRSLFLSFSKRGELPRFLGGYLDLVFDRNTGVLLDEPDVQAIRSLRQITLMFGKVKVDCATKRVDAALTKFIQCEQDVKESDKNWKQESKDSFLRISNLLYAEMFSAIDQEIYEEDIIPRHGPGATAERTKGNLKFSQRKWTSRLEEYFPHGTFLFPNWGLYLGPDYIDILEPGQELPVRVVTVPKTLKTPRIIAIEPTYMQYVQQGIHSSIYEKLESRDWVYSFIRYSSQVPNQELARKGSIDSSLATLDLSEASDRVSNQHVRHMLSRFPHLSGGVDACRSRKADVPGKGVIRLAKFASMGSALCFPMEALVFSTVVFMGIEKALNTQFTRKSDFRRFVGKVRLFGDDIIVPKEYVIDVIGELESFGFKVNSDKSFWTGKFRESCGKEYFSGYDVSIHRVRSLLPSSRRTVAELVSTVELRNHLYTGGYASAVEYLDSIIERIIPFPRVLSGSPALGRLDHSGYDVDSWDKRLQSPLVRSAVLYHKIPNSHLDDYGALMKFFLNNSRESSEGRIDFLRADLPTIDSKHLDRAGRPVAAGIKLGKVRPY